MKYRPNKNLKDITGTRYGHLVVTGLATASKPGKIRWFAKCDCGNIKPYQGSNLKSGKTNSCSWSCIYSTNRTHGGTGTPEYSSYTSMLARCYKPNTNQYHNYGGRGIIVCKRWLNSFPAFLEDMGKKPTPRHQIDRKNSDGDYTPDNCRWATVREQANNRRSNTIIEYKNKRLTISQWAELTNLKPTTISERLRRGWTIERTLGERARVRTMRG